MKKFSTEFLAHLGYLLVVLVMAIISWILRLEELLADRSKPAWERSNRNGIA